MPDVVSAPVALGFRDATGLRLGIGMPWRDGTLIASLGSPFVLPAPPPGATPTTPSTAPGFVFDLLATRSIAHAVVVTDLRDDVEIDLDTLSIATDADSIVWTLSATGHGAALFERLTTGEDQAAVSVTIDGFEWDFLIEDVQRSRAHNSDSLQITGRSQTVIAGAPYQYATNWINNGPTTAAQIADQAQTYTGVELEWHLEDWLVPDAVFSLTGTPLEVIKSVADSVGAIVESDRTDSRVTVSPRYRLLPNEWAYTAPDIEVHLSAALVDGYQRADKPSYDGVYVSGQAHGVVCWARLAWTTGARLAPMVTDPLITEEAAGAQRGAAILGGMGPQATVQTTLPFLPEYGPVRLSAIVRAVDVSTTWYGMVRGISIAVDLPTVRQQITIERHLGDIFGDEAIVLLPPAPAPAPSPAPAPTPAPAPAPAGGVLLFRDLFFGSGRIHGHLPDVPFPNGATWVEYTNFAGPAALSALGQPGASLASEPVSDDTAGGRHFVDTAFTNTTSAGFDPTSYLVRAIVKCVSIAGTDVNGVTFNFGGNGLSLRPIADPDLNTWGVNLFGMAGIQVPRVAGASITIEVRVTPSAYSFTVDGVDGGSVAGDGAPLGHIEMGSTPYAHSPVVPDALVTLIEIYSIA